MFQSTSSLIVCTKSELVVQKKLRRMAIEKNYHNINAPLIPMNPISILGE